MNRRILLGAAAALLAAGGLQAQEPIVPGEVTRGMLRGNGPRLSGGAFYDDYLFEGRRGETVIVTLASPSFDTYLYLGLVDRGRWEEVARDDDGGGGTDSRIELRLPESGTYAIRASSLYEATGPYTVTLTGGRVAYGAGRGGYDRRDDYGRRDEYERRGAYDRPGYGDPRDDARGGPIRAGERVAGFISTSDPTLDNGAGFHVYSYYGRRGERVVVTLHSADFDAYLVLGTPGGRHGVERALARDDDGGGGTNARLEFTLPDDREYAIRVNPLLSGTGRYVLEVRSGY